MTGVPIRIVTVSREFGSGGSDLAHALGRTLGWRVVDRGVVAQVARTLHVPEEDVEARDEATPRLGDRLGQLLAGAFPEVLPPVESPAVPWDAVAAMSERIVVAAAAEPPVIIVGHGGVCLFQDDPAALHVRVTAPESYRVEQVMARLSLERDAAEEEIRTRDQARRLFIHHRFDRDWTDVRMYAVVLNSQRVSADAGAAMLAALIASAEGRPGDGASPPGDAARE